MTKDLDKGSKVVVSFTQTVPLRYRGRKGTVVGLGNRNRFLVSFGDRRANPLEIAPRFLKVA